MLIKNYNCDGSHCNNAHGEVRVYPMSDASNLILCHACWAHENRYRFITGRWYGRQEDWPQHDWSTARVYEASGVEAPEETEVTPESKRDA